MRVDVPDTTLGKPVLMRPRYRACGQHSVASVGSERAWFTFYVLVVAGEGIGRTAQRGGGWRWGEDEREAAEVRWVGGEEE